ncbi:hypothetical protein, partial [Actinomadura sp. HBU206391]|uniref:hypothetical protein n=1 Tax=Actinomadura sp. HBU206391 TaxID=2731692 RepID=UPI0021C9DE22
AAAVTAAVVAAAEVAAGAGAVAAGAEGEPGLPAGRRGAGIGRRPDTGPAGDAPAGTHRDGARSR